jgi:hypothetical protein
MKRVDGYKVERMAYRKSTLFSIGYYLVVAALLLIGFVIIWKFFPVGWDYYYYYRPFTDQWFGKLNQAPLDGPGLPLVYPAWTLLVLLPPGLFPLEMGSALLNYTSLILLFLSIYIFQRIRPASPFIVLLAILNLHTAKMFGLAQLDMFSLAGVAVSWWAIRKQRPWLLGIGFCLLAIKPANVILVGLVFLFSLRTWPRQQIVQAFVPPLIMVVISTLLAGINWPIEYLQNFDSLDSELAILIWRAADQLGLPRWPFAVMGIISVVAFVRLAWREGLTERTVGIAIATTFVFSFYAQSAYYVLLIPAFIYVARRYWWLALLAYAFTWAPLLRAPFGPEAMWVSIFYPVLLLIGLWLESWPIRKQAAAPVENAA